LLIELSEMANIVRDALVFPHLAHWCSLADLLSFDGYFPAVVTPGRDRSFFIDASDLRSIVGIRAPQIQ
jgi:hypothetical protein